MPFEKNNYLFPAYQLPKDFVEANYQDLEHDYDHPNLNSLDFRQRVSKYSPPTDFPRFFTSLDMNNEGLFIMASNNYTTNIFDCAIAGTFDFDDFTESRFENFKLKETLQTNCTIVKFLTDTKFFAATTESLLIMYTTQPSSQDFHLFQYAKTKTKGAVGCLEKVTGTNQIVVGTKKGHLEIFNFDSNLDCESQIIKAHAGEITGISSHPSNGKCWATSSSDHSCVLWDKNQALPASFLLKGHRDRLTDVKWISERLILTSDSSGNVNLIDSRNPKVIVSRQKVADRTINMLSLSKDKKTFGVISESPVMKIYRIDNDKQFKLIHEHSARPYILYSMVWDAKDENTCYVVGDKKYAKKITLEN